MIAIMSDDVFPLLLQLPGRHMKYSEGEAVFRLQDRVQNLHVICEGRVHLVRHQRDGTKLILQRADAKAVLAEASLYSPHYHCDAIAETESVTWAVSRTELKRHLQMDAVLSEAWSRHLAHEVQKARLHAEILSLKTVSARVDSWIDWHGALPEKGRWASIAQQIGVSPESLYREIAKRRK
jgi:CRP/FNR family transcriptional regulator, dissimilatory nitrate respiration regulator